MKIIIEGNRLKKPKVFNCKYCGCKFEADNTEYDKKHQYQKMYYYCYCPTCGNGCSKDEE